MVQNFPEGPATVTEADCKARAKLSSMLNVEMAYAKGETLWSELPSVLLPSSESESERTRLSSLLHSDDRPAVELPSSVSPPGFSRQAAVAAVTEASTPAESILNESGSRSVKGASGNSDSFDSSASCRRLRVLPQVKTGNRPSDFREAATPWHRGVTRAAKFTSQGVDIVNTCVNGPDASNADMGGAACAAIVLATIELC